MKRRQFVAGAAGAGLAAQSAAAAGDEEAESYDQLDSRRFPSEVTIAWLVDRFVQIGSEDAPVVGADVTVPGYVLERIRSVDDLELLGERFEWADVDYTEADAFASLFSAVAWPLEGGSLSAEVFDSYDLLWVAGVHDDYYDGVVDVNGSTTTDRQFYELYGHTPFLFALVPTAGSVEPGATVAVSGTVEHTGADESELSADTDGGYLYADSVAVTDALRTPDADWTAGDRAEFTGLQHHPRPRLSTVATDVEYTDELPRPRGGSLVRKTGDVTAAMGAPDDGRATKHELASDSHDVLVGETVHRSWEEDEEDVDAVNISLVIDTSGSMSDRDTGWEDDDGRQKTRLAAAQAALREFLDFIEDGNRVSLVEFNSNAHVVSDTTVLDEQSREVLKEDVDSLEDTGWTTIGGGMRTGMETIVDEPGPKTIVLLSDGEENRSPYVDDVLPELRNHGITVHTIGMGEQIDENQLGYIADQTGGDSLASADAGRVREFYREMIATPQLRSEIARQEAEVDEGDTLEGSCSVDSSCDDVQFVNTYEGSEMQLTVTDAEGTEITEDAGVSHRVGDAHEVWTIEDPPAGEWQYQLDVLQVDDPQQTMVQVNAESSVDADFFVSDALYEETGYVRFQLKVEEGLERYVGADASLEVRPPTGDEEDIETIPLYDDGDGPDDVAGDGIYSNYYHPTEAGEYDVTAVVEGGDYPDLRREFSQTIEIGEVVANPIRPFEERSGSWSPLDNPLALALLGGLAYGAFRWYRSDGDAEPGAETTGTGPDSGAAAADPSRSETADAETGTADESTAAADTDAPAEATAEGAASASDVTDDAADSEPAAGENEETAAESTDDGTDDEVTDSSNDDADDEEETVETESEVVEFDETDATGDGGEEETDATGDGGEEETDATDDGGEEESGTGDAPASEAGHGTGSEGQGDR